MNDADDIEARALRPARDADDETSRADDDKQEKKSAATQLVEIAQSIFDIGISTDGEPFAITRDGPRLISTLRCSKNSLRVLLARQYFRVTRKAAAQQALADALLVLEGMAQEAEPRVLSIRVAQRGTTHYVDIGDTTGRAIEITAEGWQTIDRPHDDVLFRRTALTGAFAPPVVGGTLDKHFWPLVNISVDDRPLVLAAVVATFFAAIAHPIIIITGEQGSAKTTTCKNIVDVCDPSPVTIRKPPRDPDQWVTAAIGSWCVCLDNLSEITPWLSDSLCRAVSGDGDVRRKLYTDADQAVFAFRRCIIINGIDLSSVRGDLADRMLPIHLDRISEDKRQQESDLIAQWDKCRALALGAILDAVSEVIALLPSITLKSKPRMADYAHILAAVDALFGTSGLQRYIAKQTSMATEALSGDEFIVALIARFPEGYEGTSAELTESLMPERPRRGWPTNARATTRLLRRQAPVLRKAGWGVADDEGANQKNVLRWKLIPPETAGNSPSPSSSDPRPSADTRMARVENGQSQDECLRYAGEGCQRCEVRP